ncbi:MAG: hypothetical protein EHM57_01055 [Actinobacteria bacterium]|nr:MAG: hypothetical protein EHM57_01055 [Actinomycetota bacterium]
MEHPDEGNLGGASGEGAASGGSGTPDLNAARAAMSIGEQLVAVGAIILVVVDLIAGLLMNEFYVPNLPWFLAVLALVAIAVKRLRHGDAPMPHAWILKVLGYSVGFLTIYYLLIDLRNDLFEGEEGIDIFWGLVTYAGGILMGFGAYRMSQEG